MLPSASRYAVLMSCMRWTGQADYGAGSIEWDQMKYSKAGEQESDLWFGNE